MRKFTNPVVSALLFFSPSKAKAKSRLRRKSGRSGFDKQKKRKEKGDFSAFRVIYCERFFSSWALRRKEKPDLVIFLCLFECPRIPFSGWWRVYFFVRYANIFPSYSGGSRENKYASFPKEQRRLENSKNGMPPPLLEMPVKGQRKYKKRQENVQTVKKTFHDVFTRYLGMGGSPAR